LQLENNTSAGLYLEDSTSTVKPTNYRILNLDWQF